MFFMDYELFHNICTCQWLYLGWRLSARLIKSSLLLPYRISFWIDFLHSCSCLFFLHEEYLYWREWSLTEGPPRCVAKVLLKHSRINTSSRSLNSCTYFKCHLHRCVSFDYIVQCHNIATWAFWASYSTKDASVFPSDFGNNCVCLFRLS